MIERAAAWALLTEFTHGDSLRKHARAVEAAMRAYAGTYGEDAAAWGIAGMLHDFDYEIHPTAPQHRSRARRSWSRGGYPKQIVYAILAHADYSGCPGSSLLDRALYACDEPPASSPPAPWCGPVAPSRASSPPPCSRSSRTRASPGR